MIPIVISVSRARAHRFSKTSEPFIALIQDHGVEGDAHAGSTVQHRFHKAKDPTQPNLCQVHLIQAELHDELNAADFDISPGGMGENILTRGIDLLSLSTGTRLHIGPHAVVEVTGLRNPCSQLNRYRPGLLKACLDRGADGQLIRKAGIMGVVLRGGVVRPRDAIRVDHTGGTLTPLVPL